MVAVVERGVDWTTTMAVVANVRSSSCSRGVIVIIVVELVVSMHWK